MLKELSLDDTTYAALVEQGRRRIPGLSHGAWTDHNAHDPGITLLELYASLLEQRVFWLDQVSPELEHALLRLLGVVRQRARAARTVVVATYEKPQHVRLLRGRRLLAGPEGAPLTFTLDESIAVVHCGPVDVRTSASGGRSRLLDLSNGRTVVLFPNHGGPAEVTLDFALSTAWTGEKHPVALLFQLMDPKGVRPSWDPEAKEVPPPVQLSVQASVRGGMKDVPFKDGTGGFRRSGILRVHVPDDWSPATQGEPHRIRISTPAARFTVPPRLVRLSVNAAQASHRARCALVVDQDWPKLPGQKVELAVAEGSPIPGTVRLSIREGSRWRRWREVEDLTPLGPGERAFVIDGRLARFGDGITGRQPVLELSGERLRVSYQAGGGTIGNIGKGLELRPSPGRFFHVETAVPAEGGRGDETLEEARTRAAELQKKVTRAARLKDYETLAEGTPGVAIQRAMAVAGMDERYPLSVPGLVTVYVLPAAPRGEEPDDAVEPVSVPAPMPDPGALAAVRRRLETARLVSGEIHVQPPNYREVRLSFEVGVRGADVQALRERIDRALRAYLDPLIGGDEGEGWPLGGDIDPSALIRRAQDAAGDEARVEAVGIGLDGTAPERACGKVAICACYLPKAVEVSVRVHSLAEQGGLQ